MWTNSKYIKIGNIIPQVMQFPGGELQIRIPEDHRMNSPFSEMLSARLTSSNAIMELLLTLDALKHMNHHVMSVFIPYFPYARQDRVCSSGEAFSLRVIASLLQNFKVVAIDPHSDVLAALLPLLYVVPQWKIANKIPMDGIIISPDAGAEKKALQLAKLKGLPLVTASKVRDTSTGAIIKTRVHDDIAKGATCYIVDDICDGGRTFIELAKVLREKGAGKIELFVTHGIFSQGFDVFKGLIDKVHYTNSLQEEIPANEHDIKIITKEI